MKASHFAALTETQQLHKLTVRDSSVKSLQGWGGFPVHGQAGRLPHMLTALACLSARRLFRRASQAVTFQGGVDTLKM